MIQNHLENPFANSRVGDGNYDKICFAHLERLKKDNDAGQWSDMIAATEPLLGNFRASVFAEKKEKSISEGKTAKVDMYMGLIKDYIKRKEGVIADLLRPETGEYQEFFPYGLTEYTNAPKKEFEPIVQRMIDAIKRYEADFGAKMWQDLEQLFVQYKSERSLQQQYIGSAKTEDSGSKQDRTFLARQMFLNLLDLLKHFVDNTERVLDYYDLSMFKTAKTDEEPPVEPPPVPPTP